MGKIRHAGGSSYFNIIFRLVIIQEKRGRNFCLASFVFRARLWRTAPFSCTEKLRLGFFILFIAVEAVGCRAAQKNRNEKADPCETTVEVRYKREQGGNGADNGID